MKGFLLTLLLLCAPAAAQENALLFNKQIQATIPKGLYSLTPRAIAEDYTNKNNRPQHVFRNKDGDYSIAFNHMNKPLTPRDLIPFHTQLKTQLEAKLTGIQWIKDGSQTLNQRQWEVLEFKAPEQGLLHHNWILLTSWKGRVLEIAVTAADDIEQQREVQIGIFLNSLRVND